MITPKKQGRLKDFIAFMQEDDSPEIIRLLSKKNLPSVFGPESFIALIKERYYLKKARYEVPESKHLAPEPDAIINMICEYYNVVFDDLLISRRGVFKKPRIVAIYLLSQIHGDDLNSRATFKTFQFGRSLRWAKILTAGIHGVFRGLKFSPNAEIGQNGAFCNWLYCYVVYLRRDN